VRILSARNLSRGIELGDRILEARTHWTRLRGMLGRPEPGVGEGLLLMPCQAVHMFGMRYPLDVAFLADDGIVVAIYDRLQPSQVSKRHPEATTALELRAGTLGSSGTRVGDRIELTSANVEQTGDSSPVEARVAGMSVEEPE
jgi:uncharacterized membrane protein (UPF0127 family)